MPSGEIPRCSRLADLVSRLRLLPQHTISYLDGDKLVSRSYPELYTDIRTAQQRLRAWGVEPRTRVGIWGRNSYEWVVHELALLDLGCVSVTLPEAEFAHEDAAVLADRYHLELLLADSTHCVGSDELWLVPLTPGAGDNDKVELRPRPRHASDLGSDVFSVVFSSGTTGALKAIQVSRVATEDCLAEFSRNYDFKTDDAILVGLPLSTFQQRIMLYCAVWYGFHSIVVNPSPLMFLVLKQAGPTIMGGPPAFYEILENRFRAQPAAQQLVLRAASGLIRATLPASWAMVVLRRLFRQAHNAYGGRMRLMLSGSAPLRRSTAQVFELVGLPLYQLYGLTESGFIAWNRPGANRIESVGRPVFTDSVRIAEDGEILVRWPRPQSPGYVNEPVSVERATYRPDGWIATGDLGRFDREGYLYVVGRKKDIIVTRAGYKIAPSPVEQKILAEPAVAQAVLVGGGELEYVGVIVVLREHACDDGEKKVRRVVEKVNAEFAPASRIQRIVFTREPFTRENGLLTTTLKLNRRAVAQRYRAVLDSGQTWYP